MYSQIFCLFLMICTGNGLTNNRNKIMKEPQANEPLFLTPLIENGEISKAQLLSRVKHSEFQNVESYSGYITVNKTYNSNLFIWYFPAESDCASAPVILWLNGGPGSSSLLGIFTQNGPFYVTESNLKKREYYWSRNHNVIYIDNPVGTGFSFTENEAGYARNQVDVGSDLYNGLLQFFQLFPSLQKNDFYATGESYAGKYVPAVSYTIHQNNADAKVKINLKGLAIGNGFCDPIHQLNYGDYLYQLGLIDDKENDIFHTFEKNITNAIENHKYVAAFELYDALINGDKTSYGTVFYNQTGFKNYFNYFHTKSDSDGEYMKKYIERLDIRKAIHVGIRVFHVDGNVEEQMKADFMHSVAPWISELLSHYRCLFYNGQLDIILAYPLTVNFLRNLKFSADAEYLNAERRIWKIKGEIAGYSKAAGNLTEVLVRNAGHKVAKDQPLWAWDLISRFTAGRSFY